MASLTKVLPTESDNDGQAEMARLEQKRTGRGPWIFDAVQVCHISEGINVLGGHVTTDFKFGQCIQRVHPNKSPLKILEKRECGRIQGLPNFWVYPLLSQERERPRNYFQLFINVAFI